ncbi:MAG: TetR/AcrR family transcriptional regulator [Dongiaceae bacterium]
MTRTVGSHGPTTSLAIQEAGLRLIYEHGYEAMSLRQLAAEVGLQSASLYNHITTKQDLLFKLIHAHMIALLEQTDAALSGVTGNAEQKLRRFIHHHLTYHMAKKQEVFVANFELRGLDSRNYKTIIALRRNYESRLIAILDQGMAENSFDLLDTHVSAYAILAMLTGACTWYKPNGRLSVDEVVELHTRMLFDGCLRRVP